MTEIQWIEEKIKRAVMNLEYHQERMGFYKKEAEMAQQEIVYCERWLDELKKVKPVFTVVGEN